MRSRKSSTSSREERSPRWMASAWAARPAKARSVMERRRLTGARRPPCQAPPVDVGKTIGRVCAIPRRGAGTDAERRAAVLLAGELRECGHEPAVLTQWLRPGWAAAVALGTLLAAAGSLVGVAVPLAGVIVAALAAAGLTLEAAGRSGPLRVLSRRRATQTVVCEPAGGADVELLVCAAYDAPRRGLVLNHRWRALGARLRNVRAWLAGCALAVGAACAARLAGVDALWLGVVQL